MKSYQTSKVVAKVSQATDNPMFGTYQPTTTEVPEDLEVIPGTLIVEKPSASVVIPQTVSKLKGKPRVFKKRLEGNAVQITKLEKPQRPQSAAVGNAAAIRRLGQAKSRQAEKIEAIKSAASYQRNLLNQIAQPLI